ncbi:MAG: BamA/TamA family outer membrane protein, partial [Myxococcota bacterium]
IGEKGQFRFGHRYQFVEIEEPDRNIFIQRLDDALPDQLIENRKHFTGASFALNFDTRKDINKPVLGTVWKNELVLMAGLNDDAKDLASYNTSLAFYHSFNLPAKITFATRFGFGVNFGDYEFFQAQTLGGKRQIRGFRKTRFYGDRKFFNNTEIRLKLLDLKTYVFPASLGLVGFHDIGRVWYKNEAGIDPSAAGGTSTQWHQGFGGGLWFSPFNMATLSTEVGVSEEETQFYIRLGFLF